MYGPKENGFWSASCRVARAPLKLDTEYRVVRHFVDYDGTLHPVGEQWRFVGSSYAPYDDGLSLFVQTAAGEWHIRMQLDPDAQGALWDAFDDYVKPARLTGS